MEEMGRETLHVAWVGGGGARDPPAQEAAEGPGVEPPIVLHARRSVHGKKCGAEVKWTPFGVARLVPHHGDREYLEIGGM